MKTLITIVFLSTIIIGCGKSGDATNSQPVTEIANLSASGLVSNWSKTLSGVTDNLSIGNDGAISSSYCGSSSQIASVTVTSSCPIASATACGVVTGTNNATNGKSGCLPVGAFSCQYATNASQMIFTCGGVALVYSK